MRTGERDFLIAVQRVSWMGVMERLVVCTSEAQKTWIA